MKLILRIIQIIVTIILVPILYELAMTLNVFLAIWYSSFKWIWIIFLGLTMTLTISYLISSIIGYIINLLKRNTIAPKIILYTLIPILLFLAGYHEYLFFKDTDFDNGKDIFCFIAFTYMTLFTLGYTIMALSLNKLSEENTY